MNGFPVLIIVLSILIALAVIAYITRPRPRCPECKSYKVGIVSKDPQGMRGVDYGGGGAGGGRSATQLFYDVTYRCNNCGETWKTTLIETS